MMCIKGIQSTGRKTVKTNSIPAVLATNVDMRFGDFKAVDAASFSLEQGQFLTILGPSGSGKTTLLRMIAGFLNPTNGEISINGQAVNAVAANKRSIGMVFQKLALFPHMTAAENVAFPLKMRRFDATKISNRVSEFMELVRLDGLEKRRINELSGGQQQRVAIARALVFEPDLLLLDEPLAALDRKLREEMQLEFRRIQKELGVTTINVTHDQREALVVSDQIIVMDGGKIQQDATPTQMYRTPGNPFVANFIGVTNVISGELTSLSGETVEMRTSDVNLSGVLRSNPDGAKTGAKVKCAVRAEQIRISADKAELDGLEAIFEGTVTDVIFEGERLLYELSVPQLGPDPVRIFHHDRNDFATHELGRPVHIGWESRDLHVFVAE
jgi:putative spermidine/putrescine transport system ATP-binding protein